MNLSDYIINDIKPLNNKNSIRDIQKLFNQLTYTHVPILDNNQNYLGCFSETDAHCFESDKIFTDYLYAIENFHVKDTTVLLDILEAFAENSANIMPVLDKNNTYLGYYELNDIISVFNESPFISSVGNILIIEKGVTDYSFSEISQIVESNKGSLLGIYVSKMNADTIQVTLKISNTSLNDITQTFRRYGYNIISGEVEDYLENLKERSDYLNKYLNI